MIYRCEISKTWPTWCETFSSSEYNLWNFDGEPDEDEENDFIPQEIDNIPWMAMVRVVPQAFSRLVLPGEGKSDRQFDWIVAAQEYDDIINNIVLSSNQKNQIHLLFLTKLSNLLFSIKNHKNC